jgi:RNA polymerase sigma-70 factor (ECF subfamily)
LTGGRIVLAVIMMIEDAKERDKATEIYMLYNKIMLYVAKSILHDTHLAEDAVSEAFIRIIKNLHKINEVDCYQTKGFVVIIVRNISVDILRHRNRNKTILLEDYDDYATSQEEEPVFDTIATKEACRKITEAIHRLNKNYADILYLRYVLDYSNEEIAKLLSISQENVKMRLCRARKGLKRQLLKEGDLQ